MAFVAVSSAKSKVRTSSGFKTLLNSRAIRRKPGNPSGFGSPLGGKAARVAALTV
jgi:hypothetical protein